MASGNVPLPEGFQALAAYSEWCISSDAHRIAKRLETPFPDVVGFYDAVMPYVPAAMAHLATCPVGSPSLEDINLLNLLKTLAEMANAVEIYHQGSIPDAGDLRYYVSRIDRDLVGSDLHG